MSAEAARHILHVDMDAFYASVEQLDNPALRGKPVLVGGSGPRGVVTAASYESRVFGCRSAQPMSVALRLCPHAIVVKTNFHRYREVSNQVFALFHQITPLVQPLSIDEAFLDVTGSIALFGDPVTIATRVRRQIVETTGVTASIGVAPNKFLAKLASDMNKPDGMTIIRPADIEPMLAPLPVSRIFGVGPATEKRLAGIGIKTFADLRKIDPGILALRVGDDEAARYKRLAWGEDDRPVEPDRTAKSIGQEETFGHDLADPDAVRAVLLQHAEEVGRRVRRNGLFARGVVVKIRFGDFQTITRRTMLATATDVTADLWQAGRGLFDEWARKSFQPVRLIGLSATDFAAPEAQLELFEDGSHQKQQRLDATLDKIRQKFGEDGIRRTGV
jgi:DNA polymerase-4